MKKAIYLFICFVFIISCDDEAYDSNIDNSNHITSDFSPVVIMITGFMMLKAVVQMFQK